MPLDPKAREFIDQMEAAGGLPFDTLPLPELRQAITRMAALAGEPEPVAQVDNRHIAGPAGAIPVRIYTPTGRGPFPILVFFHGGGWVIGNIDSHDGPCRTLANAVPAVVVSVDYRLAPEHPFPAAADDTYAAAQWAADHAPELNGEARRLAVMGDSAGGNLAAVVALMARDREGPKLAKQVLVYPVTDGTFDTVSYRENGNGYFLTRDMMMWFWNQYAPSPVARSHAYASPLRASNLKGVAPAHVITAEFDPLRDEGEAYAARLREANVAVQLHRYDGMFHGFFALASVFPQAKAAVNEIAESLRAGFGM
jgi:acetyl esterase